MIAISNFLYYVLKNVKFIAVFLNKSKKNILLYRN